MNRVALFLCFGWSLGAAVEGYFSPSVIAVAPGGKTLYVAGYTGKRIAVVDTGTGKVARHIELGAAPGGLVLSSGGDRLYAAVGGLDGEVLAIETARGRIVARIPVGHTPMAPVLSRDGKRLYVCNRFQHDVSVIDPAAGRQIARIAVVREPVAADLTPDGATLLVANLLPEGPANADVVAASVSLIDTRTHQVRNIRLPNGSTGVRGICAAPGGRFAYVTHTLAHHQVPTTQLERGWMNTNALTIIDPGAGKLLHTVLLDDAHLGAANPWGVACTAGGARICVAHAGTHEVSLIDRAGLHERLAARAGQEAQAAADLSLLAGLRQRIQLAGRGPRGLAAAGGAVYAAEYFSDSVAVIDLNAPAESRARSIPLGPRLPVNLRRRGEFFFHDASLCFQQWQSCASCHPDARADALNWDLLNDGIGNPKNTRSMLLSHRTPPSMTLGVRETAEDAVRSGIRVIQFAARPEQDAAAIDEYLKALEPVPSPYLTRQGALSAAAVRGKALYQRADCGRCHSGPEMTSGKLYDVGTGTANTGGAALDTPTLIEVWRTAPYLHDGRSGAMLDLLGRDNPADMHGKTRGLTPAQLRDLAEYILSL